MERIVFYDGYCPMCNGWVRRLLRWDRSGRLCFAPLEGETARALLTPIHARYLEEDTIIFYDRGVIAFRSEAALQVARHLGFPFSLAVVGRLIPRSWRDGIYDAIASRRYRWGARYDTCPIPPAESRSRFLP